MHSKIDNIEVKTYDDPEEVFESLLSRYKIGLEKQMRGSNFIFDCANLTYYRCNEMILHVVIHILILQIG